MVATEGFGMTEIDREEGKVKKKRWKRGVSSWCYKVFREGPKTGGNHS